MTIECPITRWSDISLISFYKNFNTFGIFSVPIQLIPFNYCWKKESIFEKSSFTFITGILLHWILFLLCTTYCMYKWLNKHTSETVILAICRNSKIFYTKVVVVKSPNLKFWFDFSLEDPLIAPIIS